MRVALYEPLPMIGGMGAAGNLALHDGGSGSGLALEFCELNDWAMLHRQRNCSCEKQNNCLIQTLNRGPRLTAYGTSFDSA